MTIPNPQELYVDLAIARAGAPDPRADDDAEALSLRRRIAALATLPGVYFAIVLAAWSHWNLAVSVISLTVVLGGLWVFGERWQWLMKRLRRTDR